MSDTGIVQIHGKAYETVALRVKKFRADHKDFTLSTEIIERTQDEVVMKATILDSSGRVIATGHSEERRAASQINRTSALENAETSAIGRALAAFGLGGTEFATADEVAKAIAQGNTATQATRDAFDALPSARQKVIADTAIQVIDALREGREADAYGICESVSDTEEKLALWSRLDSKQRSAIKKFSEAEKKGRKAA